MGNFRDPECVDHPVVKGDAVFLESVTFATQPVSSSHVSTVCTNCLRPITGSLRQKMLRQPCSTSESDSYSSKDGLSAVLFRCPFGSRCTAMFCSEQCCKVASGSTHKFGWHRLLCIDEGLIGGVVSEFENYCMHTSETFLLVAKLIARTISISSSSDLKQILSEHVTGVPWHIAAARSKLQSNCARYETFSRMLTVLKDELFQAWELLMLCWSQIQESTVQELVKAITLDKFSELAASLELTLKPATWERSKCVVDVVPDIPFTVSLDDMRTACDNHTRVFNMPNTCTELDLVEHRLDPKVNLCAHSLACVVQGRIMTTKAWNFLITGHRLPRLMHSCCPNAQIELETSTCGLLTKVVALRNVTSHEPITVSYVDTSMPVERRQQKLISQFGIVCSCAKCCWESKKWYSCLKADDMYKVALQYLEEDRYYDAEILLRFLLCRKYSADVLHSLGQAFLGQDKWGKAHALWRGSQRLYPFHSALRNQIEKDDAYRSSLPDSTVGLEHPALREFVAASIWLTEKPILSKSQCALWIRTAEWAAHAQGGWNTSRHYAVPTTDLPIHSIPGILDDWNQLMDLAIAPALATVISNAKPQDFRVHDAFIVKYDSNDGQYYLPVHRDQGQLSLTIALNDHDEYTGGGTLFHSHDVIVRPSVGNFVAFKSALLHAGAPILNGKRYIIAVFLYLEDPTSTDQT